MNGAHGAVGGPTGHAGGGIQLAEGGRQVLVLNGVQVLKKRDSNLSGFIGRCGAQEPSLGWGSYCGSVQHVLLRLFALL